ncbi:MULTISPECIES: sigma factor-like helix-turn-helix DNA-binding protein [Enterococcus]|uniref:HNH nuclease domain-containing protein n=1 Tax=Candidatus Enterococcus ferrettii TaxID=2815324 RepID=A0ABV0ER56_9ENTE|nr:sigma factor-like helix-turn-helix DNA-binding protein [Enterococcus sp. 665A]MBO1339860.1 HNH endonuclease [Enterococcus sp. 665A]
MRRAIVGDGNFEVHEDGTILKIKQDGTKVVPFIRYFKSGNKKYPVVSNKTKEGKTGCLYVHRLMAEAFLPNPEQKKFVLFKNGNPQDFKVENLMWDDGSLSRKRKMEDLKQRRVKCSACGETMNNRNSCIACRMKQQREQKILRNKQKKLNKIISDLAAVNLEDLSDEHKKAVIMRRAGKSFKEIAKELGKSSERVRQIIESAKKNQPKVNINRKSMLNQITPAQKQEFPSKTVSEEAERLRRMFLFGEGSSSRYFYGE